jgi:hypothetical protein
MGKTPKERAGHTEGKSKRRLPESRKNTYFFWGEI